MTTNTTLASQSHRLIGWAAAAGTLPYLTLKSIWLSGGSIGVADPAMLRDPSIEVLNWVTVALDLTVIGLALALTRPWGRRLPAWAVLLPMWVGTGLLLPMAVAILPATLIARVAEPTAGSGPGGALEPWVQPLVYGGFAWQGIFLITAFALYARSRWSGIVEAPGVASRGLAPLLRVVATGGAVMAGLSGTLYLALGVASGSAAGVLVETVDAGLAAAGAVGVLALVRGAVGHRWLTTAAAWAGSAAMFSWGLWGAVTTMAGTALSAPDPLGGMANLTGLLGGFALAVAGLLALLGTGVAHPAR